MPAKRNIVKFDVGLPAFTIIGISSHENDYRLSWSINEQTGLSFVQSESHTAVDGRDFTRFVHDDESRELALISNRCDNGFLLEKYKNFDFILKFDTELTPTELSAWMRDLKRVPLISAIFPIPLNKQLLQILT